MPVEILMPELGESVHEGTVSAWLKKVGDEVKEDEPVVEIMTDKVNTELPAPASGTLVKILVEEGDEVEVFKPMGLIETDPAKAKELMESGGDSAMQQEQPKEDKQSENTNGEPQEPDEPVKEESGEGRLWFSPVVRAMAREHSLDDETLASIDGSGKGGRVTKKDVEAYLKGEKSKPKATKTTAEKPTSNKPKQAPTEQKTEKLTGMRKMIAEHMERSSTIPTVSTLIEVDVTNLVAFRERNKESFEEQHGVKLTYTPFFIKAIAESLVEYPDLNTSMPEQYQVERHPNVNMGIAVALGKDGSGGLIVPVIRECENKSLVDISRDLIDIAEKARTNDLDPSDVQGGTFTLTNPGTYGATLGTPMISYPQAGIVGTYGITERATIVDGMIAIRKVMNVVLTYDHRLADGLKAGRFLQSLKQRLEEFDFFK